MAFVPSLPTTASVAQLFPKPALKGGVPIRADLPLAPVIVLEVLNNFWIERVEFGVLLELGAFSRPAGDFFAWPIFIDRPPLARGEGA